MLVAGLAVTAVAKVWPVLIVALLLLSVGQGCASPSITSLVTDMRRPTHRGEALGFQQSANAIGRVVGPPAAGCDVRPRRDLEPVRGRFACSCAVAVTLLVTLGTAPRRCQRLPPLAARMSGSMTDMLEHRALDRLADFEARWRSDSLPTRRGVTATPMGYQPGLDGVRAISVIAVILYHAGFGWMHGGFLGVEVFFVVSGYLITSLLLEEQRQRTAACDLLAVLAAPLPAACCRRCSPC